MTASPDRATRVPESLRTERILLRRWRASDAPRLAPVLEANHAHLAPWIPKRVAQPGTVAEIATRLAGFELEFDAEREWRYGLFRLADEAVLGEVGLFPRDAERRVAYADADRIEVGYWLRSDATGGGLATEAARAALGIASSLGGLTRVEIRCDPRNAASAAIPRRLGFTLERQGIDGADGEEPTADQLWVLGLGASPPG